MLIDIVGSRDRNVIKREAGKIFKMPYNIDAPYVEHTKGTPIPVIIGAPGTISIFFRIYPDHIPVNHDTKELQNTTTMGNEQIFKKLRMLK
jgi:hypothetical protein